MLTFFFLAFDARPHVGTGLGLFLHAACSYQNK